MNRHKHADLIIAWANGEKIEFKNHHGDWEYFPNPTWKDNIEYRIKPAEKKLTPCYLWANNSGDVTDILFSEYEIMEDEDLKDAYPIKLLWSETMLDLGDEE